MIFNIEGHIEKIIKGEKTQTRRSYPKYIIGRTYSIQPKRTSKAIPEGRIRIIDCNIEDKYDSPIYPDDALAEGGYTPEEYEKLYSKLNPKWEVRIAYTFKFEPSSQSHEKGEINE